MFYTLACVCCNSGGCFLHIPNVCICTCLDLYVYVPEIRWNDLKVLWAIYSCESISFCISKRRLHLFARISLHHSLWRGFFYAEVFRAANVFVCCLTFSPSLYQRQDVHALFMITNYRIDSFCSKKRLF